MPRILVRDLVPDMVLQEDVYSADDTLILPKGTKLTDKQITALSFYTVQSVKVTEETSEIKPPSQEEIEDTYSERIRNSVEFKVFEKKFEQSIGSLRKSLSDLVAKRAVNINSLYVEPARLVASNPSGIHMFDMLHNMRLFDDPTYVHSLNVSLICNVFGRWLGLPYQDVKTLTLCGLMHDVGKMKVPDQIIGKPARLTEEEFAIIKRHALEGYYMLKDMDIDNHIKMTALMHHERCDGTGYPSRLTTEQIDPFARIVAIADVYDAMTSARVYRGPICPFKVIEIFEEEGLSKYDPKYILTFLHYITDTYMNNSVELSNGKVGKIVMINKLDLARPLVKTSEGYVDLYEERDISIEKII